MASLSFVMNDISKLAINKVFTRLAKDVDLQSLGGKSYPIKEKISFVLSGSLTIGESYVQVCNPAIPWNTIALIALSHLNSQTQSHIIAMALQGESFDLPMEEIKESVESQVVAVKGKAQKVFKGKVTDKLAIA